MAAHRSRGDYAHIDHIDHIDHIAHIPPRRSSLLDVEWTRVKIELASEH
jgi:hypothetical protein